MIEKVTNISFLENSEYDSCNGFSILPLQLSPED